MLLSLTVKPTRQREIAYSQENPAIQSRRQETQSEDTHSPTTLCVSFLSEARTLGPLPRLNSVRFAAIAIALPLAKGIKLSPPTNPHSNQTTDILWTVEVHDPPTWNLFLMNISQSFDLKANLGEFIDPAAGHLTVKLPVLRPSQCNELGPGVCVQRAVYRLCLKWEFQTQSMKFFRSPGLPVGLGTLHSVACNEWAGLTPTIPRLSGTVQVIPLPPYPQPPSTWTRRCKAALGRSEHSSGGRWKEMVIGRRMGHLHRLDAMANNQMINCQLRININE
ncbi:hypothetical protein DFH09DRAFT_1093474 [Mycena vulgaris]|nr:hypothetical protein DFH09DRAFT_1093474 [Mycena vulgaris]